MVRSGNFKATVIVPVYNRAEMLPRAIRSIVRNAQGIDLDILIVDDGSTDNTPEVIKELMALHSQIRVVQRENGGVTKARNTGLEHIAEDADIVTFLDSDDVMAPQRFTADIPVLMGTDAEGRDIEMTYGRMVVTNAIDDTALQVAEEAISLELVGIHLACGLYRRSLIERIGRFDEELAQSEDSDYLLRIFEEGTIFAQTDTICHYYLRHEGNMTKRIEEAKKYWARTVLKSMQRRRADPRRSINRPIFEIKLPTELL